MMQTTIRRTVALAGLVIAAALAPSIASAQAPVHLRAPAAARSSDVGPRMARAGIASELATSSSAAVPLADASMGNGTNVAMMIVGGTALVVGLSVGGDGGQLIAVGGAVIGLIGLFRYIR